MKLILKSFWLEILEGTSLRKAAGSSPSVVNSAFPWGGEPGK